MIDESNVWKHELLTIANHLEATTTQRRWTARTEFLIERDFVVGAYAIRKAIAAQDRPFPLRRFALVGAPPDPPYDIAESYDFDNGRRAALSVRDLCHEILHSFTITPCRGETADLFDGVYVSSNRKHVYLVLASDFIELCSDVARS